MGNKSNRARRTKRISIRLRRARKNKLDALKAKKNELDDGFQDAKGQSVPSAQCDSNFEESDDKRQNPKGCYLPSPLCDDHDYAKSFCPQSSDPSDFVGTILLEKVCRICGNENNVDNDIFDVTGKLREKIDKYLPGIVVKNDGLPAKICDFCIEFIYSWHKFFLKSVETKKMFENFNKPKSNRSENSDVRHVLDSNDGRMKVISISDGDCDNEARDSNSIVDPSSNMADEDVESGAEEETVEKDVIRLPKKIPRWTDEEMIKRYRKVESEELAKLAASDREFLSKLRHEEQDDGKFRISRVYRCDQCEYSYNFIGLPNPSYRLQRFKMHYESRHNRRGEDPIFCDICSKGCIGKAALHIHISRMHRDEVSLNFNCKACDKSFSNRVNLKVHERTKHSLHDKPVYMCDICGKSFRAKKSLTAHMIMEKGEKNHECGVCGQSFFLESQLRRHMAKHSQEKKFPCPQCGKLFKLPKYVTNHTKSVHAAKNDFPCHLCAAVFTCQKYLAQHLRGKQHRSIH